MRKLNELTFACLILSCAFLCKSARFVSAATTCQPEASWRHTGCTAHGIEAPSPQLASAAPLWEGHSIAFTLGTVTDKDHCCVNGPYVDYAETEFTYDWYIQKRLSDGTWVIKDSIGSGSNGANWNSEGHTAAAPNSEGEYRVMVRINDTPGTGDAKADDDQIEKYSDSFILRAPTITNFHQTSVAQQAGGNLHFEYAFESTCGHLAHLNNVTFRENVTHDVNDSPHDTSHSGANCFNITQPNPTLIGFGATGGLVVDDHGFYGVGTLKWQSHCGCSQLYQNAYQYPGRPDPGQPVPSPWPAWDNINSGPISIHRYVESNPAAPPTWRYRVTKAGATNTMPLP